jgi:opacity protein-like surface antigen
MRKLVSVIAVLSTLVFVTGAKAATQAPTSGFYLGVGGSYAWENFDNTDGIDIDNTWGFNAHAGYQFMKYLALEANYDWLDDFDLKADGLSADLTIQTLMLDVKLTWPIDPVVPYVRGGIGWMWAEIDLDGSTSDNDFAWNLGAGVDYFFTKNVSLGLDFKYVWGTGDLDDFQYTVGSLKLTYHF